MSVWVKERWIDRDIETEGGKIETEKHREGKVLSFC